MLSRAEAFPFFTKQATHHVIRSNFFITRIFRLLNQQKKMNDMQTSLFIIFFFVFII